MRAAVGQQQRAVALLQPQRPRKVLEVRLPLDQVDQPRRARLGEEHHRAHQRAVQHGHLHRIAAPDQVEVVRGAVDQLAGDDGDDKLYGGTGNDTIWGGEGKDTISGDADNDLVSGGGGDDLVRGRVGGPVG